MALEEAQKLVSNECKLGHVSSIKLLPKQTHNNLNDKFEWSNIPMFAVITGKNGVGKTSLLEAIRHGLLEKQMDMDSSFKNFVSKTFMDEQKGLPKDKRVEQVPRMFDVNASCMPQVFFSSGKYQDALFQIEKFDMSLEEESNAFVNYCIGTRLFKFNNIRLPNKNLRERFEKAYQTFDFTKQPPPSLENPNWFSAELKNHWINYISKRSHLSFFGTMRSIITRLIYIRCDWTKLNSFLTENGFKYHIGTTGNFAEMPTNLAAAQGGTVDNERKAYYFYKPKPPNCPSEQYVPVAVTELSPGEEIQLVMLLWRYDEGFTGRARENGIMLLDEPDAHLHPSLVSDLINAYRHEFVTKQGVQVIITTHNPTTVSMVDKENIFVMSEDNGQATIRPATSKEEALRCLLPPHISVHDRTRVVFVDSDEDEIFFDVAYQIFKRMTNPKIGYRLLFTPLCPSGITTGIQVVDFVNRLTHKETSQTFSDCVFGIVVATSTSYVQSSRENSNVFHLRRGNLLSYIYDPVHLYFIFEHLAEKGRLNQLDLWSAVQSIIKLKLSDRDIISILCGQPAMHVESLQLIVTEMTQLLKTMVGNMTPEERSRNDDIVSKLQEHTTEAETIKVEFRNSTNELFKLEYPKFWFSFNGDISQFIFDQFIIEDNFCNSKEEFTKKVLEYCRDQAHMMFPAELGAIFSIIQGE